MLMGMKWKFKHKIYKCLVTNYTNMRDFHPVEDVRRGGATQSLPFGMAEQLPLGMAEQ